MQSQLTIIPAIDLMDGQCVRLQQGDAKRKTVYHIPPETVAKNFEDDGAKRLHIVDLDGAFAGSPVNLKTIENIRKTVKMTVEVGGGIRTEDDIRRVLELGIDHVILGTRAMEDKAFLGRMIENFGADKIIVGADARNGYLSTHGWTTDSQIKALPFLQEIVEHLGVSTVIYTDITRDGMYTSPNLVSLKEICSIKNLQVIASGGVGNAKDIQSLNTLRQPNLIGVIIGKAIHDGQLTLTQALEAAKTTQV